MLKLNSFFAIDAKAPESTPPLKQNARGTSERNFFLYFQKVNFLLFLKFQFYLFLLFDLFLVSSKYEI